MSFDQELSMLDPDQDVEGYMNRTAQGIDGLFSQLCDLSMVERYRFRAVIPNNYNLSVARTFSRLLLLQEDQLYIKTLPHIAHVTAADNLINLQHLISHEQVDKDAYLALLGTGPSMWGATLLQRA
jgi:3-oxoacyl-[acyl-carrier-protein] synthase III